MKHEKEIGLGGNREDQVQGGNFFLRGPGPETLWRPPNTSRGQLLPARGLLCTVLVSFPSPIKPLSLASIRALSGTEMRRLAFKRRETSQEAELLEKLVTQDFFDCISLNVSQSKCQNDKDFKKQKGLEDKEETRWVDKGSLHFCL